MGRGRSSFTLNPSAGGIVSSLKAPRPSLLLDLDLRLPSTPARRSHLFAFIGIEP